MLPPVDPSLMKKYMYLSSSSLIATLALAIFIGSEASSTARPASSSDADSGRLVIRRVANIGTVAVVNVSVDGKRVGSIARGQIFNEPLSAGPHVITATLTSSNTEVPPTKKSITVEKGKTYTFTASWKAGALSLD